MLEWLLRGGLNAGDRAPDFDAADEDGGRHRLADYRGRWLVVFFYPRDNTPVCVREACAFNDEWDRFRERGADVLGCSGQGAASHRSMRAACRLRYRLLCDEDGAMRRAWKLNRLAQRATFLVGPDGVIRFVFRHLTHGEEHAARTLDFLTRAAPDAGAVKGQHAV